MGTVSVNKFGEIRISNDVLATIAGLAAIGCYGIVGMASKRATDGLVELLGSENLSRGVKVTTQGNEVVIDLFIIVEYGISIAAVAQSIIDTVKYKIESLTGTTVKKVNVKVEGVRV
ncbi:MAG: Asp23/Gls24 family envelope stress response protein [Caldicoprobacterales bacterium]|jgi:uncharacterized alkaline shock family protein YloU|nr:Asp23/Gls24 family envelope stress response protein [Clostridiales bacterium]